MENNGTKIPGTQNSRDFLYQDSIFGSCSKSVHFRDIRRSNAGGACREAESLKRQKDQ